MQKGKNESLYQAMQRKVKEESKKQAASEDLDINGNVRRLRMEKKLSGVELCRRAGDLDPRTLTAIEKGRIVNPSVKTLQSLARGLGIAVSDLFRQAEMGWDRFCCDGTQKGFYQIDLNEWGVKVVSFIPFIHDFFCGKFILGPQRRLTESMLKHVFPVHVSVLVGRFEITVETKNFILKEGDNLFFNGILKHSIYNPLHRESSFLMVTAPSFL
jgi:transcriptional regulator with XRE-family HTH domain